MCQVRMLKSAKAGDLGTSAVERANDHSPTDTLDLMDLDNAWKGLQFASAMMRRLATE